MSDVCREFGISRKTGYKVFQRYKESGFEALNDRKRGANTVLTKAGALHARPTSGCLVSGEEIGLFRRIASVGLPC